MGFSLNNLGDTLLQIGKSTLQTGTFYAAAKTLNSPCSGSIWSCGSFGGWGPMGMMGGYMGYPGMGLACYGLGGMSMMNPFSQYSLGQAYGQSYALGTLGMMGMPGMTGMTGLSGMTGMMGMTGMSSLPGFQTQKLKPTNNEAAEKFTSYSTELGQIYDENSKARKTTNFVASDWADQKDGDEKKQQYTQYVSNFAKSYIAYMDEKSGNKDNEISQEEFTKYNIEADLGENATEAEKAQYRTYAKTAFEKLDQNGDKKIDWKEMASMFSSYDGINGSQDGQITNEEAQKAGQLLMNSSSTTMDQKLRIEYTKLFGNSKAKAEEE